MRKLFGVLMMLVLCLGMIGCSSDKDNDKSESKSSEKQKEKSEYTIGETATVGDLSFTVNSVRVDEGGYFGPEEGKQYFVIDITIVNNSDEDVNISSLISFSLKDAEGRKQSQAIGASLNGTVDATILPTESNTGEIAYETAPDGPLTLYFKDDIVNGKTIKFVVR